MEDKNTEAIIHDYMMVVKAFNDGEIPFCFKAFLSLEEATRYTGIGINKLRAILNDHPDLSLWNGNRRMVKRAKLEKFLENTYTI